MYAHVKGSLVESTPEYVVVDVQGIGYKIYAPVSLYARGLSLGEEVFLFTSHVVREDAVRLFGFLQKEEREFFERLIALSGVGAKTALNLIGHLGIDTLQLAIQTQDTTTLSKVPGIGKKTAERIVVELADRISKWGIVKGEALPPSSLASRDALSALVNLGYQPSLAQKALRRVTEKRGEDLSVSELIGLSLKEI